jgi:hypothetical protein
MASFYSIFKIVWGVAKLIWMICKRETRERIKLLFRFGRSSTGLISLCEMPKIFYLAKIAKGTGEGFVENKDWFFDRSLWKINLFLDYSKWRETYTEEDFLELDYRYDPIHLNCYLPYVEICNFVVSGIESIEIEKPIRDFELSSGLKDRDVVFEKFMTQRNHRPRNGPIVGLKSMSFDRDKGKCQLVHAGYFDQIKTNLTMDCIAYRGSKSLRELESDATKKLPSIENSSAVNSIGICGAVIATGKDGKKFIFLKKRNSNKNSVFGTGFGTCSSVLSGKDIDAAEDLLQYSVSSMRQCFIREVMNNELATSDGIYESEASKKVLDEIKIIPLAITRELTRGGKPQFFLLIECGQSLLDYLEETNKPKKERHFKNSGVPWGYLWGDADIITSETFTCLAYALSYLTEGADETGRLKVRMQQLV